MWGLVGKLRGATGTHPVALDSTGAMFVSMSGKYREATEAGRVYVAANQAAVAVTAAMATTYTGLCLYNPVGSGKNFSLLGFSYALTVALPTAITAVGLMTGAGAAAATAVITARNRLSGGPASVAYVDDAVAFTAAPVLEQVFATYPTGALTTGNEGGNHFIDLNGSLIITPGYHVSAYSFAANTACFIFSFLWEEYTP